MKYIFQDSKLFKVLSWLSRDLANFPFQFAKETSYPPPKVIFDTYFLQNSDKNNKKACLLGTLRDHSLFFIKATKPIFRTCRCRKIHNFAHKNAPFIFFVAEDMSLFILGVLKRQMSQGRADIPKCAVPVEKYENTLPEF